MVDCKNDTNERGYIELTEVLKIDKTLKRTMKYVHKISNTSEDRKRNYDRPIGMKHKKSKSLLERYSNNYLRLVLPPQSSSAHGLATDGAARDFVERKGFYNCCPPPIGMLVISLIQLVLFVIDKMASSEEGPPIAKLFGYDPHKKAEFWRFLTYMLVHSGYPHLIGNLIPQLLLGIHLEIVHKWWRVQSVYILGIIAGSLLTPIIYPAVNLIGASAGVYAILTAHIPSVILNWKTMPCPYVPLTIILIIVTCDVRTWIYYHYVLNIQDNIGYAAHAGGAVSGILVGMWVLRTFVPTRMKTYIHWVALILYIMLLGTLIILNILL